MSKIYITVLLLLSAVSVSRAQTKVLLGLDANWNKFHMFSLGFDVEHKLDINYGICSGLKMSEYSILVNQLRNDVEFGTGEYVIENNEKVVYLTVPVGVHYYFNPRLYVKGYTNLLFRQNILADYGNEVFKSEIKQSTQGFDLDLGFNICWLYSSRTQISFGPRFTNILSGSHSVDVTSRGIENITAISTRPDKHYYFSVNFHTVIFRVKTKKL